MYTEVSCRRNLMLSNVDISAAGYGGPMVSHLYNKLPGNSVAGVISIHIGENDYEHHELTVTDRSIMSLVIDMVCTHSAGCVIISELVRFSPPVQLVHLRQQHSQ